MRGQLPPHRVAEFGRFRYDFSTCRLEVDGKPVEMQEKPRLVLEGLLENAGAVVTREELIGRLWPPDLHVDAEHGLNTAVRKVRAALDDSASDPHYVETHPRLGYRFAAPVTMREIHGAPMGLVRRAGRGSEWPFLSSTLSFLAGILAISCCLFLASLGFGPPHLVTAGVPGEVDGGSRDLSEARWRLSEREGSRFGLRGLDGNDRESGSTLPGGEPGGRSGSISRPSPPNATL